MALELIPGMSINASGLEAERMRMEAASHNLANAHSTKDVDGGPFKRRLVVFESVYKDNFKRIDNELNGVRVADVIKQEGEAISRYMPWHPEADENGHVSMPDISPMTEMVDIMTAVRAYEANLNAMKSAKTMANQTLDLLQR